MSMIDGPTAAQFLAMLEVYPDTDPGAFDRLQRELCEWWAAGGSARAFVAAHQRHAPADFGIGDDGRLPPLSGHAAMRALRAKLPCP